MEFVLDMSITSTFVAAHVVVVVVVIGGKRTQKGVGEEQVGV